MAVEWWTVVSGLVVGAALVLAVWWRRYSTRFARQGVPYVPPLPLVGNMLDVVLARRSMHDVIIELYNKFEPHAYGGGYSFAVSMVMIRDPEIIRAVTVKDFDHFTDHADFINSEKVNPIQQRMLIILKEQLLYYGEESPDTFEQQQKSTRHAYRLADIPEQETELFPDFMLSMYLMPATIIEAVASRNASNILDQKPRKEWHDVRTTLSPAFTSMKMKNMFVLMTEIGQQMVDYLWKETAVYKASSSKDDVLTVETKDFFTRITNDVIATSAFGVKVDSLSDPENLFYCMGRELTNIRVTAAIGYMLFPSLMVLLGIPFVSTKAIEYFKSVVWETIETREKQGIVRPDMLHLLMQARRGELAADEGEKDGAAGHKARRLTDEDVAAQAMIFFFAGFDTVSTVLTFCSYLLAAHEDVQQRLQREVDELMQKSGGQPSYEQVMGCQYLDMVLSETLRMYPPLSALDRQCVRPYRLPATETCPGIDLRPGDVIWLPIRAIHFDPKYYTEPERFDPERFSPENKHLIKPFTYCPFGSGPLHWPEVRDDGDEGAVGVLPLPLQFPVGLQDAGAPRDQT
ncbi:cytochrome P450 9e2-like [Schistocerca piceifrons]|uniref:cytochrome P450 9e2-like n=1 Tax=Schistocerca piceifrons TaxID=274613 RepID=UPI001F5ED70F|nr:cytochrome P450 9e2-like [Schistocerca piceifrons]